MRDRPSRLKPGGRQSPRLQAYDYAEPGTYFVTICTEGREPLLGTLEASNGADVTIHLSPAGERVQAVWLNLPRHYPHVSLDAFVIMPDHVHGLITLLPEPLPMTDDRWLNAAQGEHFQSGIAVSRAGLNPPLRGENTGVAFIYPSLPGENSGDTKNEPSQSFVGAGFNPPRPQESNTHIQSPGQHPAMPFKRHGLPEIIRGFKSFSARDVNQWRQTPGGKLWQRNYYEHVVRHEAELNQIREYVHNNPLALALGVKVLLADPGQELDS